MSQITCNALADDRRGPVSVEIVTPSRFSQLADDWTALVGRAVAGNVSMHPAVVTAVAAAGADVRILLAWAGEGGEGRRLLGVWVLAVGRLYRRLPTRTLVSPVHSKLILGGPVIDREAVEKVLRVMFDALARDRSMPGLLQLQELPGQGPIWEALRRVLRERRSAVAILRRLTRPMLSSGADPEAYLRGALSQKRRAELRRCRRRLAEQGGLEVTSHRGTVEVRQAFEEFLALEASGWKGRARTALAQRGATTLAMFRRIIEGLSRDGLVKIMALRLSGRAVAMEVTLRCGGVGHTWKSAYDESLRSFGPGLLLMEDMTRAMLADRDLRHVDMSNNRDSISLGGVGAFWPERHDVVDLLVDVRARASLDVALASLASRLRGVFRKRIQPLQPVSLPQA